MPRYIDADELIIEICKHKGCFATGEGNEPFMAWEVEDYINDAPTEDVAPVVHGHWEEEYIHMMGGKVLHRCECSECGYLADYATDYCPECGAKMDEEVKVDEPRKD